MLTIKDVFMIVAEFIGMSVGVTGIVFLVLTIVTIWRHFPLTDKDGKTLTIEFTIVFSASTIALCYLVYACATGMIKMFI
jgi:hypothetical protein